MVYLKTNNKCFICFRNNLRKQILKGESKVVKTKVSGCGLDRIPLAT